MNKIKDFFYNKNDLIIVLLILLLSAASIYFKIGDIMSYPETLKESAAQTTTEQTTEYSLQKVSELSQMHPFPEILYKYHNRPLQSAEKRRLMHFGKHCTSMRTKPKNNSQNQKNLMLLIGFSTGFLFRI